MIRKSFRCCALTLATDGSEDEEITCFKEGKPCAAGKRVLEEQMKLFNNPESRDINPFLVDDNDIGAAMPDIEAVDSDATDDDEDNLDVEM